jgi:exopolysaccharide production protein ExoQ
MNRSVYRCAVFGLLLTMMGVVAGLASPGQADTDLGVVGTEVHLPVILCTGILYMLVLSRLVADPQRFLRSSRSLSLAVPLLLLCLASSAWSNDPGLALRRSMFLVLTVVVGLIIGTDFELAELGRLLAAASLFHIALCAVFFFVAPRYLFSPLDPNALKGLTTHKNVFGFEAGIAVLVFLFVPFQKFRAARWPLTLAAAITLFLSHSSGSLVATVAALCLWPALQIVRLRRRERLPVTMVAILAFAALATLIFENAERLPALLSKDVTLTGRTELWSILLVSIQQRFWLGYGFDSFWQGLQGDSLNVIRAVGWLVPTAHNGYLDLLLSVGIIGLILFIPLLLQGIRRALHYAGQAQDSTRFFPALLLVFWLIYNLNESALLTRSGLPFFLFIAISTSLALHQTKPQAATATVAFQPYLLGLGSQSAQNIG